MLSASPTTHDPVAKTRSLLIRSVVFSVDQLRFKHTRHERSVLADAEIRD
jgi:hypothetical protein